MRRTRDPSLWELERQALAHAGTSIRTSFVLVEMRQATISTANWHN